MGSLIVVAIIMTVIGTTIIVAIIIMIRTIIVVGIVMDIIIDECLFFVRAIVEQVRYKRCTHASSTHTVLYSEFGLTP